MYPLVAKSFQLGEIRRTATGLEDVGTVRGGRNQGYFCSLALISCLGNIPSDRNLVEETGETI